MNANAETFIKQGVAVFGDWHDSLGELTRIALGVFPLIALMVCVATLRSVMRGGLSRQRAMMLPTATALSPEK